MSAVNKERKALFALALPMILSNITIPLLGLVDTGVIGHLPEAYYLGASAVGAMLISVITWFCGFLRMSTTGLAAQAYGKQASQDAFSVLTRGLVVAIVIGLLFILLQNVYIDAGLWLSGASEQVLTYTRQYSEIRIWGLPAALANLVILGWLLGMHQAKKAMWLLIITNLINLLLDLLFVIGFDLKIAGVAYATLIAEYSCFTIGMWMVANSLKIHSKQLLINIKLHCKEAMNKSSLIPYLKLNSDIVIRTLCLEACFVFITFQGARLGDTVVAANAILLNFLLLISFGLDGIAYGAEARVGKAKGENNIEAMQLSVQVANRYNLVFAILYSFIFYLFGHFFVELLTDIDAIITITHEFMPWIVILPIIACWCYLYDGIYIGLTEGRIMRNSMLVSTCLVFFPCWFIFSHWGNHGIWLAFCLFMASRGITLYWHYHYRFIPKHREP
ncbi:MATE family efflux transporter [Thalassotalea maritima]|uniref:MATE family efflux transporter n=1 Tax=Thalassotalea maritima TaxID=3242416 RepID=UPI003528E587